MESASEVWLDWVLRMNMKYPRGSQKFVDVQDLKDSTAFTTESVGWANVLTGRALADFLGAFVPARLRAALRNRMD